MPAIAAVCRGGGGGKINFGLMSFLPDFFSSKEGLAHHRRTHSVDALLGDG